jgi:uncharacterized protein (TIGR02594 family)
MLFVRGMSGPQIKKVQEKLQSLGLFKGTPRGNFGELTETAVMAFQRSWRGPNGEVLKVDGKVGNNTWGALFVPVLDTPQAVLTPQSPKEIPPWLMEAFKDLQKGVAEIKGSKDNPDIVAMHQHTSLHAQDDETPWCASAMCAWLERAGVRSPRSAAAASFRSWGRELPDGGQRLGCVAVMTRTGGNHVTLYLDEDDYGIYGLGGNQGDRVSVRRYSWTNITNFRVPE